MGGIQINHQSLNEQNKHQVTSNTTDHTTVDCISHVYTPFLQGMRDVAKDKAEGKSRKKDEEDKEPIK